jgi:hypothetical protein
MMISDENIAQRKGNRIAAIVGIALMVVLILLMLFV